MPPEAGGLSLLTKNMLIVHASVLRGDAGLPQVLPFASGGMVILAMGQGLVPGACCDRFWKFALVKPESSP